jgi:hypothetical protein
MLGISLVSVTIFIDGRHLRLGRFSGDATTSNRSLVDSLATSGLAGKRFPEHALQSGVDLAGQC